MRLHFRLATPCSVKPVVDTSSYTSLPSGRAADRSGRVCPSGAAPVSLNTAVSAGPAVRQPVSMNTLCAGSLGGVCACEQPMCGDHAADSKSESDNDGLHRLHLCGLDDSRRVPPRDRPLLPRITPAWLVEDELTDLDRLHVLRGPTGHHVPVMEIQCPPVRSVS